MLREEKGTKRVDLKSNEGIGVLDLGGAFLWVQDARDAKGEA